MKKLGVVFLAGLMAVGVLAGCGTDDAVSGGGGSSAVAANASVDQKSQGVTLPYSEDAQKKYSLPAEFSIDHMPERLIVMSNAPVEILHELGVQMIAVPDIINEDSDWAKELDAQRLPLTAQTVDTEGIIAMNPDMIIMSGGKKEAYGNFFEEKGIPVYYLETSGNNTLEDVKNEVQKYAQAFHKEEAMQELFKRFDQLEADLTAWKNEHADLQGKKMMILLDSPPAYTNNSQTALGDMMKRLGYENMTDSITGLESMMGSNTLNISTEVIVQQNPPMILAQPAGSGMGISISAEQYKKNLQTEFQKNASLWNSIDAVKNNNILYLGTDVYPGTTGLGIFTCYEYLMDQLPKMQ